MTATPGPGGQEPDARFLLANERTFLAWVRTMLALMAGAVALDTLDLPHASGLRHVLVMAMVVFAGAMTVLAYLRWRAVERALRAGVALPPSSLGLAIAVAVAGAAVVLVVVLA